MAQWSMNPTSIYEDGVRFLALLSGLRICVAVSCGVGHRWAQILQCCGCGVGWWLQLQFDS